MGQIIELDPRVVPIEKRLKMVGTAVVAVAASGVVIVGGLSAIAAVGIGLAALAAVNLGIPVGARYIALKKQQSLTALAEEFSEETIREDERQEGERIGVLEDQYKKNRAELEGAQEVLRAELAGSSEETAGLINAQVEQLQLVIESGEEALLQRKHDYEELKKQNRLLIAFHRSSLALENSQAAERNSEELQRIETARNAIKTRMRAALAGQTIQSMNLKIQRKLEMKDVAMLGNSQPVKLQPAIITAKEKARVSANR